MTEFARRKIALIMETALQRRMVSRNLSPDKYDIRNFTVADETLFQTLTGFDADIIMVSSFGYESDAYGLCRSIKNHPQLMKTKMVFISSDPDKREGAINHRADAFLLLPFSESQFHDLFNRLLAGRKTILYTDDSKVMHQKVVPFLRQEQFRVLPAENGVAALAVLAAEPVDLVITDIEMPEMNGYELCRRIKEHDRTRDIPVFILSSLSDEGRIEEGFAVGADEYLIKPVLLPELLHRVNSYLFHQQDEFREHILVADDSKMTRELIERGLRQQGFVVTVAANGLEAAERIRSDGFDLVITDFEMPGMNGYEFCLDLRQQEACIDTPVLLMYDRQSNADMVRMTSVGVRACISKPFAMDKLVVTVEKMLAEATLNRERKAMEHYLSEHAISAIKKISIAHGGKDSDTHAWDSYRTVLFTDICDFTTLCENHSTIEVVSLLNEYFDQVTHILLRYDAIIDKFIGDAVLALFGRQENGAHRAVAAARAIIDTLVVFSEKRGVSLQARAGINSGHVIVGDIGSRNLRRDFTVIGDNVNLAQRLEAAAPKNGILISRATYEMISDKVAFSQEMDIKVKGKAASVHAYLVSDVQPYALQHQ